MQQQRRVPETTRPEEAREQRRWLPAAPEDSAEGEYFEAASEAIGSAPYEALRYVVVDDLDGEVVRLLAYEWPHVRRASGSLAFGGVAGEAAEEDDEGVAAVVGRSTGDEAPLQRSALQEAINGLRQGMRSPEAAGRALRVGDTFALIGPAPRRRAASESPEVGFAEETELVLLDGLTLFDVTAAARDVAKAALFGVASMPETEPRAAAAAPGPDLMLADQGVAETEQVSGEAYPSV
jgi:hypothetical protein